MKYNAVALLILCLTMSVQFVHAQSPKGKYVIFTFEYINNKSPHGKQIYYWIQSVDSISRQQIHLDKILLSDYSESELQDCCTGKSINPYTSTSASANSYNFNKKYYMALDTIECIIKKHRKRIQTVDKANEQGINDLLSIYITPVEGIFCLSKFISIRDREKLYKGSICIPYSSFSYYRKFWESDEYKSVMKHDYSLLLYSILPPNHVE